MIDKKNIMKMASDVFHRSQGYPDKRLLHPQREWGIGLLVFGVIVVTGSALVGNIFVQYREAGDIKGVAEDSIPRYHESVTQDALDIYRERSQGYEKLRKVVASPTPVEVVATSTPTTTQEIVVDTASSTEAVATSTSTSQDASELISR